MMRRKTSDLSIKYDMTYKIVILGDTCVGKSCLLLRFTDEKFMSTHHPTIGVDYRSQIVKVEDKQVKLQLWDTSGQERYKTITSTYYRRAKGVVLVYDPTEEDSFVNVSKWLK